jgi:nucleoside-diphosphate-sugar epimerase
MIRNILIVGASSLLGKTFYKTYKDRYTLFNCGRTNIDGNDHFTYMDLSQSLNATALPQNIDAILYLAQSYKFRDFPNSADDIFQINTARVLEFLNYAKSIQVKKFIYASTGGVYTGNKIHEEDDIIDASKLNGFYATSKYCGELLVNQYKPYFDVTILRPFFMYGKEQKKDMLIPRLIHNIKNKQPIQLQGEQGIHINPIYVQDAVSQIEKIIDKNLQGIFNLAGNQIISLKELSLKIGTALDIEPIFTYTDAPAKDVVGGYEKLNCTKYEDINLSISGIV